MRKGVLTLLLGSTAAVLAVASSIPLLSSQSVPGTSNGSELAVAVSTGLQPAVTELARGFEQKTGNHVRLESGESDSLYAQISKGAGYDVFFSTEMGFPRRLVASGVGVASSLGEFGHDPLAMSISPMVRIAFAPGNPLLILRDKAISHVAIADPQHTTAGKAAEESLRAGRVYDVALRRKLVIGKDPAQVADLVKSGDADVALLPMSAIQTYGLWSARTIAIAPNLYRPIKMGAVVITRSKHRAEGLEFLRFARSPAGQAILRRAGL
jgi:molybdate transport system substrate-binding protein